MSKKQRLFALPAFFIIMHVIFLNASYSAEIFSGFEDAGHNSPGFIQLADTVPESHPDTLLPSQTQNTVPEIDTIIRETVLPDADTITTDIESDLLLEPDTIQPDTQPAPSPPPVVQPIQQIRPDPARTTFDKNIAYWVESDSLLIKPGNQTISRVFSARDLFGSHSLEPSTEDPQPEFITRTPSKDFLTFWIIFSFFLIGLTRFLFPLRFKENILAAFTGRYFNQLDREGGLMNNWASFFLFLNFLLVFSLLIYLSLENWGYYKILEDFPLMLSLSYILLAITAFYMIKYILVFFVAWIFKTQAATESYFLNILLINQTTGIILLPILVISVYNPTLNLILSVWILLILFSLFKIIRGAYLGYKTLDFSVYYLILYLCAIEFAPLILIIKLTRNTLTA